MKYRVAVVSLVALLIVAALAPAFSAESPKNVVLISWDGVQREHVKEMLAKNRLPNLAALIKDGGMVDIDITHQSDTKAGHAQMLTGYDPETTGVYSNSKFQPIPAGYSIFERLRESLGKDKIKTVMLTAKTHHIGNCGPKAAVAPKTLDPGDTVDLKDGTAPADGSTAVRPRQRRLARANQVKGNNQKGEPWYLVYKNMDVWDGEKARTAEVAGPLALGYLDKYSKDRFFMFFNFSDPDTAGHKTGENSPKEDAAYIACDKWLGDIVKKLKDKKLYDKTVVFVNSDHGFDEDKKTHKNAPRVFLASNDKKVAQNGNQRDIVPTILTEMGVDCSKFKPAYPGRTLTAPALTSTEKK